MTPRRDRDGFRRPWPPGESSFPSPNTDRPARNGHRPEEGLRCCPHCQVGVRLSARHIFLCTGVEQDHPLDSRAAGGRDLARKPASLLPRGCGRFFRALRFLGLSLPLVPGPRCHIENRHVACPRGMRTPVRAQSGTSPNPRQPRRRHRRGAPRRPEGETLPETRAAGGGTGPAIPPRGEACELSARQVSRRLSLPPPRGLADAATPHGPPG